MTHSIGDKLRILRESMGMTQDDLAEATGMNRVTIAKYEIGKIEPKSKSLSRLAAALDVSTDYLVGQIDEQEEQEHKEEKPPQTPEARLISASIDSMPEEKRKRALNMFTLLFEQFREEEKKG